LEPVADYRDADRILLVRLDAMGDVLMTTPAIRAVRRGAPGAHVALLTSRSGAALAGLLPDVDSILVHAPPWLKPGDAERRGDPAASARALIEDVATRAFDAAIVFTVNSQSPLPTALALTMAGVGRRAAYCRENPYLLLTDWLPEPEPNEPARHEVQRQLDLVGCLGFAAEEERLSLRIPPEASRSVRSRVADLGLGDSPWAVLHPGASAPSRRYPAELFAAAARSLVHDHGWSIVLTGEAHERSLTEGISRAVGAGARSLAGELDLPQLAALLSIAPVLISGNTGPVHMAAAVGTPVVDVYALTNPQHSPWRVPHVVLINPVPCAGCRRSVCPLGHHACLRGIDPDRIVEAALRLTDRSLQGSDVNGSGNGRVIRVPTEPVSSGSL
jgi:lipopolysaccharide heptosyltransferase II